MFDSRFTNGCSKLTNQHNGTPPHWYTATQQMKPATPGQKADGTWGTGRKSVVI